MNGHNLTIEGLSKSIREATIITHDGKTYINPRKTHGWKEILLDHFSQAPTYSHNQFKDEYGVDVSKATTVGAIRKSIGNKLTLFGISTKPIGLYQDAKKRIRELFFNNEESYFDNFTSAFYSYMNPDYSEVIRVYVNGRYYYIILGK
ncbi:hypothetical protein ACFC9N_11370 [Enterococcus casseliflavus]|uniref:hypothetical protein n=1 Tax=Enterococcus TaxID=1350 RepID=UPI000A39EE3B|nr:hypothetical protein [Enterococcus sp. 4E1_DIV0656]OTO09285.1 hypothetical protein A5882_003618 [Enterococcus sp. 4E1_DIV0656]